MSLEWPDPRDMIDGSVLCRLFWEHRSLIDEPPELSPEILEAPLAPGWEEGFDRNTRAIAFRHLETGFVTFELPSQFPFGMTGFSDEWGTLD